MDVRQFYRSSNAVLTRRVTTVSEAIDAATSSRGVASIVVLPPAAGDTAVDSDVEDIPENLDNEDPFEVAGELEVEEEVSDDENEDESGDDSSDDKDEQPAGRKRKRSQPVPRWKKAATFDKQLPSEQHPVLEQAYPLLAEMSPVALWRMFFDELMIEEIVEQTNLYARREKNSPDFNTDASEISRFLGILLLSGYHSLPQEGHYWSNQQDLGVPIVAEAMSRNRFYTIKSFLHLADNEALPQGNKIAKVKPLYKAFNDNLIQFGFWHGPLSIDESMVPYYGRHGIKMFIRGKPIRFGFKIWALCGTDGFPYHLRIYTGRQEQQTEQLPLGTRVILHMVNIIQNLSLVTQHHIFFDNFFSSYNLFSLLADRGMKATGTIRDNRSGGVNSMLISTKEMKKKKTKGDFDHRCDGTVFVVKWYDNAVVSVASNCLTHEPLQTATRRVKGNANVNVKQPYIVRKYNEGMGGVDVMDRLLSSYRPMIRGKKWWWPLFVNILNLSVVAAWRAYCNLHHDGMDHLTFRREIVLTLLKAEGKKRQQTSGGHHVGLPADVRYDGVGHDREGCEQGRCRMCQKNTRHKCGKCDARLHTDKGKNCFLAYHTQ